jgi:tetratricopeptide (TPR) repeat protein
MMQQGRYEEAIRAYAAAKLIAPQYSYLPYNLGLLYRRTNRVREAQQEFLLASKLAPARPDPYTALGLLRAAQRRWPEADRYYQTALKLAPAGSASRQAALHNRGLMFQQRGDAAAAIQIWSENAIYLPSLLSLAAAYADGGRAVEAVETYRRALTLAPEHLTARLELAGQLGRLAHWDQAILELQAASRSYPRSSAVQEALGAAYESLGHPREAANALARALELTHDREVRKRLSRRISNLRREN